jgi:hypothetical protein
MPSLIEAWPPTVAYVEAWNSAVCRAGDEVAKGWMKFVGERLAKNGAFAQQVAACRSPSNIYDLYAEFWQEMVGDYTSEFSSMTNRGFSAAQAFIDAAGSANITSKVN